MTESIICSFIQQNFTKGLLESGTILATQDKIQKIKQVVFLFYEVDILELERNKQYTSKQIF